MTVAGGTATPDSSSQSGQCATPGAPWEPRAPPLSEPPGTGVPCAPRSDQEEVAMRRGVIGPVGTLIATAALAACGSSSSPPSGGGTTSSSTSSGVSSATVALHHVPTGDATLSYDASTKTLTVEIRLTGLAPS